MSTMPRLGRRCAEYELRVEEEKVIIWLFVKKKKEREREEKEKKKDTSYVRNN